MDKILFCVDALTICIYWHHNIGLVLETDRLYHVAVIYDDLKYFEGQNVK